jgi:hypothetical protein
MIGNAENVYRMMERQIEGKRKGSHSGNSSWWSSTDGVGPPSPGGRVVSNSPAAISIDPPGDIVHTGSLRTTTQKNDGVDKVRKQKPGEFDIICGRGRSFQEHSGNRVLRQICELHRERYKRAKRTQKAPIAGEIVSAFKANGDHFLKYDDNNEFWEEIDGEVAKEKVSHCFRSIPLLLRSSSSSSSSSSSMLSSPPGNFQQLNSSDWAQQPVTANTNWMRSSYQPPVAMATPLGSHLPTRWPERGCTNLHDREISRYQFNQSGANQLYELPVSMHTATSLSTGENADTSLKTYYIEDFEDNDMFD